MKSLFFCSFFLLFFSSAIPSFAGTSGYPTSTSTNITDTNCPQIMQPWNFDVTVGAIIGGIPVRITFKVHCDSDMALLVWIGSSGGLGCDVAQGINNPGGNGGGMKKNIARNDFIQALEDITKIERKLAIHHSERVIRF